MAINVKQFGRWSDAHKAAVLGSHAGEYGAATGSKRAQLLRSLYKTSLAKKAAAADLPHPGYSNSQFSTLVNADPNLVQLRQANATSRQQSANIGNWWDSYKQAIDQANKQSNAGYSSATTQNQQATAAARGLDTSQAADLLKAAAADAAQRGQTVDPKLAADLANAAASRASQGSQYGSLIGTIGANANSYLAGRGATAVGQRAQLLSNEEANAANLARQYGAAKSATRLKLSSQIQGDATDAALKRAALGETATRDANTAASQAANIALRQQSQKSSAHDRAVKRKQGQQRIDIAQQNANKSKTPKGGFSPKDVAKVSDKAIDAINQARQIIKKYTNLTDSQLRQAMANGYYTAQQTGKDALGQTVTKQVRIPIPKISADYVNSALDIERLGGLGKVNVQRLHARHIKIGGRLPVGATSGKRSSPGGDVQSGGGYSGIG